MRQLLTTTLALAILVMSSTAVQADHHLTLGVIEKAIKAAGGAEKLAKLNRIKITEEGIYHPAGDTPFNATVHVDFPSKLRVDVEGIFTIVVNEKKAWMSSGGSVQALEGDQLEGQQIGQYASRVSSLLPLVEKENKFELTAIDGEKVNDKETVGVKVAMKDKPDIKLFFDKNSGLLVKTAHKVKAQEQGFEEVDEEHVVTKYQDVEGAKFPAEIAITRDGEKYMQAKYIKVEAVKEFPKGTFDEPK